MNMEFNPFKWGKKQETVEEIFPQNNSLLGGNGDSSAQAEKFKKESRERKIRDIQLPPEVDEESVKKLVSSLENTYRELRKKPKSIELQTEVVSIQNQIRETFDNSAEAEVLLANIDIDIEASLRKGTIDNMTYKTYQKLGDLNMYEKFLKGKTPEWIDKHLPTLSKMAASSVSLRVALSAAVVAGGGIVGGAIALPWLSVAVAAGIGGAAGFYAMRTLYKSRKEKEYNTFVGTIAKKIAEKKGIDNLTPNEIKKAAEGLVHGAHHLGKAVGLKEDGSVDTESIVAQVLMKYDKLLKEAGLTGTNVFESDRNAAFIKTAEDVKELYSKYSKRPPIEEYKNKEDLQTLGKIALEDFITSDVFLTAYKQELERIENADLKFNAEYVRGISLGIAQYVSMEERKEHEKQFPESATKPEKVDYEFLKCRVNKKIYDGINGARRQGLKDLLKSVRDERQKEIKWGIGGFLGGAAASTLIRSLIYFGTHHAEEIQDWWTKHVPRGKGGGGAEFLVDTAHTQAVGGLPQGGIPSPVKAQLGGTEATVSISLPATPSTTPSPEVMSSIAQVSPLEEQSKMTPGFLGETNLKPKAPVVLAQNEAQSGVEGTKMAQAGAAATDSARPSSLDNTTLADQYNFLYGEKGSESDSVERIAKLFKKQGIDFAQGVDGETYDTLTAEVGKGLSTEDTAEDHILMHFLGKVMKGTVHDTFDETGIKGFPSEEKGALLNFMYNLRKDGLLSFDKSTGTAILQYNPEELAREYDEWSRGHDWVLAKADDYAKKISSERWNRWFGFENESVQNEAHEISEGKKAASSQEQLRKHDVKRPIQVPLKEKGVPEWDSKEHLAAEKGPVNDENIDEAEKRLKDYGAKKAVQPAMPSIPIETAPGIPIESIQSISAEAVSSAATESAAAPSGAATESAGVKAVSAGATESIAAEAGTPSAKVEPPVAEKIPAKIESEQKIIAPAVLEQATPSGKAETSAGASKAAAQSVEELTPEKRFEDVANALHKEYGIPKKFIKEISGSFSVKHFMASISAMLEHAKHTVPGELSHFHETGNVSDALKNKFAEALLEKDFSLGRKLSGVDYHNLTQLQTFLEGKNPAIAQKELILKDFLSK